MPRKPTGKIYELLTPEQREEVRGWLSSDKENVGYLTACERIKEKWGVDLDKNALWRFHHHRDADLLQEKLFRNAALANDIISGAEAQRDPFSAIAKVIGAAALTQATGKEVDWKTIGVMVQSAVAARKQLSTEAGLEHDAKRLDMDQRKFVGEFLKWFADEEARRLATAPELDADARTEALGQRIFGDLWTPAEAAP